MSPELKEVVITCGHSSRVLLVSLLAWEDDVPVLTVVE